MPHVSLNPQKYNFQKDVEALIRYIYNPEKTAGYRFVGFAPGIIRAEQPGRDIRAALMFHDNHKLFGVAKGALVHQIVLSFTPEELTDPMAAWQIGETIAQSYFEAGYFCAYGVHGNTGNLHIHFAVDNISYLDGKTFFIQGEVQQLEAMSRNELAQIRSMANAAH